MSMLISCRARVITCSNRDAVFPDGFLAIEGDKIQDVGKMATLSLHPHLAGSLESGKFADFVILDKNPMEDIRAVRSISQVVKAGKSYRRDELDKLVPECERFTPDW